MDNTPNNGVKVPFDPGWNDPPKFSYNAQQTTPSRPRNFLNKRVAFPLAGGSPAPSVSANLPPVPSVMPVPFPVPSAPVIPTVLDPKDSQHKVEEGSIEEVKGILLKFLEESSELGPKSNDIKRRLSVMEDMWANGKLNSTIHLQMKKLAYALRDDEPGKADDIHRALMVDHVSAVGTWMPGVKHLIHHSIARAELLAIDKE